MGRKDTVAGYKCHGDEGLAQDADDISLPVAEGSRLLGGGGAVSLLQCRLGMGGSVSQQLQVHSSGAAPRA